MFAFLRCKCLAVRSMVKHIDVYRSVYIYTLYDALVFVLFFLISALHNHDGMRSV